MCLTDLITILSASKVVVGTQIGVLSIFNRSAGWGDCVDRIPGYVFGSEYLIDLVYYSLVDHFFLIFFVY